MDHRDDLIAHIGDLWIGTYTGTLVSIVKSDTHFITYLRMQPDSKEQIRKRLKSDFYSIFRKIKEEDLNGKAKFDFIKAIWSDNT